MSRTFSWLGYLGLWLFGIAFGLMEASVVVYLRALSAPDGAGAANPTDMLTGLAAQLLATERIRELTTLAILAVPAALFARRLSYKVLAFLLCFGVWDLSYYGFLKLMLNWPPKWLTLDVLFLVPRPWVAPVLCPVLISGLLVVFASGCLMLGRTRTLRLPGLIATLSGLLGGALVMFSFLRAGEAMRLDYAINFVWWPFAAGYALLVLAAASLLVQYYRLPRARFF